MASEWIKWTKGLADKREVVVLASKLGRDRHEIAGRLMKLWEWCDDNIPDDAIDDTLSASLFFGDTPLQFLDALLGLPGFADAMASPEVCWLTVRSGCRIEFPNLGRHNGKTAKTRAVEAQKKRNQRDRQGKEDHAKCPDMNGTNPGPEKNRNKYPPTPQRGEGVDWKTDIDFQQFWQAYPKHSAPIEAWAAWKELAPDQRTITDIVAAVLAFKRSEKWREKNGQYIPKAAKFLREDLWKSPPTFETSNILSIEEKMLEREKKYGRTKPRSEGATEPD